MVVPEELIRLMTVPDSTQAQSRLSTEVHNRTGEKRCNKIDTGPVTLNRQSVSYKDGGCLMKKRMSLIALALILCVAFTAGAQAHKGCRHDDNWDFKHKSIDFDDGTLTIEHEDEDWIVEITDEYDLYVDGERVKVNREQKKLLRRYYRDYEDIEEMAAEIGADAAKIGVAGAKLGVAAVACVAKAFLEDYDCDVDIDIDIDIDEDEIEKMADKLQKKADKIEDKADDLEKTHRKLRKSIPELGDLEDF